MDDELRILEPVDNPVIQAVLVLGVGAALMSTVALSGVIGMAALVGQAHRIGTSIRRSPVE